MTNYPAYCYVSPVAGDPLTLNVEDDLSADVVRSKYADPNDQATFTSWANGAHTGDITQISNTFIVRRNG